MLVPAENSEGVGMAMPAGTRLVRAKEVVPGVEATARCPDDDPATGGTLMSAVAGRLVVPLFSVFWRQNQTPAATVKASKIQGNRLFRPRIAPYLVSGRTSRFSHRHREVESCETK